MLPAPSSSNTAHGVIRFDAARNHLRHPGNIL
jgi:hypothetical protein